MGVIKPAVIEAPEIEEEKTKPTAQEQSSHEEGSELVKEEEIHSSYRHSSS